MSFLTFGPRLILGLLNNVIQELVLGIYPWLFSVWMIFYQRIQMIQNKLFRLWLEAGLDKLDVLIVLKCINCYKFYKISLDIETITYNDPWKTFVFEVTPASLLLGFRSWRIGWCFKFTPFAILHKLLKHGGWRNGL